MSKVSEMAKMWEKKGQEDNSNVYKSKPVITNAVKKQQGQQSSSTTNQQHSTINNPQIPVNKSQVIKNQQMNININPPQRFTFQPQTQSVETEKPASNNAFKNQLEQRLKLGGSLMGGQNIYMNPRPYSMKPKSSQQINQQVVIENQSANYKNSKQNLENFYRKKSENSNRSHDEPEQPNIMIPQTQYTYGQYNDAVINNPHQNKQNSEKKQQSTSFLPKDEMVTKSQLNVKKPKSKPVRNTHLGAFEDSD